MGAPMREAILDTLQLIPRRVPRRERSGVMFAKAAEGTVTRAAEKKPAVQHQHVSSRIRDGGIEKDTTYPTEY